MPNNVFNPLDAEGLALIQKYETGGLPGQELGITELASGPVTVTTSQADVTGFAVTVTVPAGARIFVEADIPWVTKVTSAGYCAFYLQEDGTTINSSLQDMLTGATNGRAFRVKRSRTPSTGSHTYKVQGACQADTAAIQVTSTVVPSIRVTVC